MNQQKFIAERRRGQWIVHKEREASSSTTHGSQEAAWCSARRLARGAGGIAELKSSNGRVIVSNTYRIK